MRKQKFQSGGAVKLLKEAIEAARRTGKTSEVLKSDVLSGLGLGAFDASTLNTTSPWHIYRSPLAELLRSERVGLRMEGPLSYSDSRHYDLTGGSQMPGVWSLWTEQADVPYRGSPRFRALDVDRMPRRTKFFGDDPFMGGDAYGTAPKGASIYRNEGEGLASFEASKDYEIEQLKLQDFLDNYDEFVSRNLSLAVPRRSPAHVRPLFIAKKEGGAVKNFKPQTKAPKGALCACGDNLGPHYLTMAGGGTVGKMAQAVEHWQKYLRNQRFANRAELEATILRKDALYPEFVRTPEAELRAIAAAMPLRTMKGGLLAPEYVRPARSAPLAFSTTPELSQRQRNNAYELFGRTFDGARVRTLGDDVPLRTLEPTETVDGRKVDKFRALLREREPLPPLLVDDSLSVADGHHRLEAAKSLRIKKGPVLQWLPGDFDGYAEGGSVPESRAPWAPQPGFTDPTWAKVFEAVKTQGPEAVKAWLRKQAEYMANRAAPYYGGQRGVNGAANLKEQLDMLAGTARGATAATVGLPGDLQALGRAAMSVPQGPLATLSALQEPTLSPTSEDLKTGRRGFLARGAGTPGEAAGETLGDFIPLIPPSTVRAGARAAGRGLERVGRSVERGVERGLEDPGIIGDITRAAGRTFAPVPTTRAVKPRGGNFAENRLAAYLNELGAWSPEAEMFGIEPLGQGPSGPVQDWMRTQLRNYLRKDLGAPTDPLLAVEKDLPGLHLPEGALGAGSWAADDARRMNDVLGMLRNPKPLPEGTFYLTQDADGKFAAFLRDTGERFGLGGSPEEALKEATASFRASEVRGGTNVMRNLARRHAALTSDPATPWGMLSGSQLHGVSPGEYIDDVVGWLPEGTKHGTLDQLKAAFGDDVPQSLRWLEKAPPDTKIWSITTPEADDLGFGHVRDYLEAATEPYSRIAQNFPRGVSRTPGGVDDYTDAVTKLLEGPGFDAFDGLHPYRRQDVDRWRVLHNAGLTLDPDSLGRLSVADAVRKTAQWNKFMAEQDVADGPLSKGWKEFKAYPDKGMRWVEFGRGELPEGWVEKPDALGVPSVYDDKGQYITQAGTIKDPRAAALREGLAAEGDAMGHCVGGYCDDVLTRGTKIYSLRDAKGRPHVTIEVRPDVGGGAYGTHPAEAYNRWRTQAAPEEVAAIEAEHAAAIAGRKTMMGLPDWALHNKKIRYPDQIVQIKGKGNAAPVEEYLPFVQDFVRSGKWGRVGDLRNTGLLEFSGGKTNIRDMAFGPASHPQYPFGERRVFEGIEMPKGYMTAEEASKFLQAQGVPEDMANNHVGNFNGAFKRGYAHGGQVRATEEPSPEGFLPRTFDETVDYALRVFGAQ